METCQQHSGFESDIKNLKNSDIDQWQEIKKLQNRLPVWATLLISTLTFFLGCALTYAALAVKITEIAK